MEKYRVYHNESVKPRNRAEHVIVEFIKIMLAEPIDKTIKEVRDDVIFNVNTLPKSWGKVEISEIHTAGKIWGKEYLVERSFTVYGRGRRTYTISINESVFKDSSNNFKPVESVLNS